MNQRPVMLRRAALLGLGGTWTASAFSRPAQAAEDAALDALLARYRMTHSSGIARVRYAAWKAAPADIARLENWIAAATARRPSAMPRPDAFAFWCNLYNALTLREVLQHYPVHSVREIRSRGVPFDPQGWTGPWRTRLVTVEDVRLSLDDIEHNILRPNFVEARVHYALNCAALGCPNLPAGLERQLTARDIGGGGAHLHWPPARRHAAGRRHAARLLHLPLVRGGFRWRRGGGVATLAAPRRAGGPPGAGAGHRNFWPCL